jgi:hypothetical protein
VVGGGGGRGPDHYTWQPQPPFLGGGGGAGGNQSTKASGVSRQATYAGTIVVDASIAARAASFINQAVIDGAHVTVTSSFRTSLQQGMLWMDRYVWGTKTDYPVAFSGTSGHEAGFAIDIQWNGLSVYSQNVILQAAHDFGFTQDPKDLVHFFDTGGYGPYGSKSAAILANQTNAAAGISSCGP